MTKILIATPCALGYTTHEYSLSLVATCIKLQQSKIDVILRLSTEADIGHARNTCAAGVMGDPTLTHLMFIDSDMKFPADGIQRLMAHDKPLIGGFYVKKDKSLEPVLIPLPEEEDRPLMRVATLGTGFMLIQRRVFEEMHSKYESLRQGDTYCNLFETVIKDGRFWSTDYTFCNRYRAIGGEVWLDQSIPLGHVGKLVYQKVA